MPLERKRGGKSGMFLNNAPHVEKTQGTPSIIYHNPLAFHNG